VDQILKYSDERHEEDRLDLTEAARLAEDVLRATNEAIRRQESDAKLRLLSETIILPGAGSSMARSRSWSRGHADT
jgi:predicted RNase H-like nuclease